MFNPYNESSEEAKKLRIKLLDVSNVRTRKEQRIVTPRDPLDVKSTTEILEKMQTTSKYQINKQQPRQDPASNRHK